MISGELYDKRNWRSRSVLTWTGDMQIKKTNLELPSMSTNIKEELPCADVKAELPCVDVEGELSCVDVKKEYLKVHTYI